MDDGVQGAGSDPVEGSGVMGLLALRFMTWADGNGGVRRPMRLDMGLRLAGSLVGVMVNNVFVVFDA